MHNVPFNSNVRDAVAAIDFYHRINIEGPEVAVHGPRHLAGMDAVISI